MLPFTFLNTATDNAFAKTWDILGRYSAFGCSVSGGSDSDIMLDLVHRLDTEKKVRYVWFNTGLEYEATKRHLAFLESKYDIAIERFSPAKSIPVAVREYGQPFLSKFVSTKIAGLQKVGFDFSDMPYDDMLNLCNGAKDIPDWWHNRHSVKQWNIAYNKGLKEFLIANPPGFRISDKCCYYAKKRPSVMYAKKHNIEVQIVGVRKAEGGNRNIIRSCFTHNNRYGNVFRPLFWFTDEDKRFYERTFGVTHSACYSEYGLKRTGCVGCPFNLRVLDELAIVERYEPLLHRASCSLFGDSYAYTEKFHFWQKRMYPKVRFHFRLRSEKTL